MQLKDFRLAHVLENINIIGPGYSLLCHDKALYGILSEHVAIGISSALLYPYIERADYWIGCDDMGMADEFLRKSKTRWPGLICFHPWNEDPDVVRFTNEGSDYRVWFAGRHPCKHTGLAGQSSLFAAISLAAYMGAININLVGVDLGPYEGKYYYDEGHPTNSEMLIGQRESIMEIRSMLADWKINLRRIMPETKEVK